MSNTQYSAQIEGGTEWTQDVLPSVANRLALVYDADMGSCEKCSPWLSFDRVNQRFQVTDGTLTMQPEAWKSYSYTVFLNEIVTDAATGVSRNTGLYVINLALTINQP